MPASRPEVDAGKQPRVLVVGCGALARELVALTRDLPNVDITCLPATLHNRPGGIPAAVRDRIRRRRAGYDRVFVAYADCGTGGLLDPVVAEEGVERLAGAHCYEFYATSPEFQKLVDEEPATFFLTDFLARNFERLVIKGLGIDRHPELLQQYFGNYERLVYLAQTDDPALAAPPRVARHVEAGTTRLPALSRRQRALLALGGILVLGAALAFALLAVTRDRVSAEIVSVPPDSLAQIDPETNSVVAAIPVGAYW